MTHKNSAPLGSSPTLGSLVELQIDNIAHGGVCVARLDGRVVFVTDTIPGEKVVAQISDISQKSFLRADTVDVIHPSPHRQVHIWHEASLERAPENRAGGAEFGHITLQHQRQLKSDVLTDSLKRFGKIDRNVAVHAIGTDDQTQGLAWRTRVRLHVDSEGNVGPYAVRSHNVIAVESLPLAVAELQEIAPLGKKIPGVDFVDLVAPSVGRARSLAGTKDAEPHKETIREKVGSREFALDINGFWQVHKHAAETLSSVVAQMVDEALFDPRAANHDLYGGVGLFAAAIGDRFGSTTKINSVEASDEATEYAAENLSDWVGARVYTARVEKYLAEIRRSLTATEQTRWKAASVVLDPPRSGAGKEVIEHIAALSPAQLVYVACDPVALSRDVAYLTQAGYQLGELRAFDLFPHTHHMEAVAHFVRA